MMVAHPIHLNLPGFASFKFVLHKEKSEKVVHVLQRKAKGKDLKRSSTIFFLSFFLLRKISRFPVTTVVVLVIFFVRSSSLYTPAHPCYQLNISSSPRTQRVSGFAYKQLVVFRRVHCDAAQGVSRPQICLLWVMWVKEMHRQVELSNMPSVFQFLNKSVHCVLFKGIKCVFW